MEDAVLDDDGGEAGGLVGGAVVEVMEGLVSFTATTERYARMLPRTTQVSRWRTRPVYAEQK